MTSASFPAVCAAVIANNTYTLYINDAPEPMATNVSIFGAPCIAPLKPLIKNF